MLPNRGRNYRSHWAEALSLHLLQKSSTLKVSALHLFAGLVYSFVGKESQTGKCGFARGGFRVNVGVFCECFLARHGKEWAKDIDVETEITVKRRSRWINDEEDNVEEDETEQIRLSVAAPFLQPNRCSHVCLHKHCILLQELQLSCWW